MRVIGDDGGQLGVMPTHEALRMAEEKGLDLVEVSPKAVPPVCRVMDYGKFKYEQSKKASQAKKHASVIEIKEIKFRPKTDDHDYDFKIRHIRRFLEEGNKVRLVIAFRGREIVHPETGRAVLERVIKACTDVAHVEQIPMMDGRRMVMIVSPRPARTGAAGPVSGPVSPVGGGPPRPAVTQPGQPVAPRPPGGGPPRPQTSQSGAPASTPSAPSSGRPPVRSGS